MRAAITEVSLRDSDVAAADMQTIEDGPRGEELEPDNNPQAPVLQQPESFFLLENRLRLTQPLIPAVALPHGDSRKRN